MYEINFEIPAFLLSVFCLVYSITANRRQYVIPKSIKSAMTNQHFLFLMMLLSNMLSSISSVIGLYLTLASFPGIAVLQYLFHAFYFIFHPTLSIAFCLYVMNVTSSNAKWKKGTYIIFVIPYILSELMVLTNSFTGWAFYMDENNAYHRGPLMPVLYALGILYLVLGFIYFIKNKKAIPHVDSVAVGAYIIIATIGIILQAVRSSLLVEMFAEATACLIIMIVLEEKGGHTDPTTNLLNRTAFIDNNRLLISSKQNYSIIIVKVKDIEKFNKNFGIKETDDFLINVASYLVKASEVIDVYSYRRGLFAIILKGPKNDDAKEIVDAIYDRFNDSWAISSVQIKEDIITAILRIPEDIQTLEELEALLSIDYQHSEPGSYFIPEDEIKEMKKINLYEKAIRNAIDNKQLMVKFQPIWSCSKRCTVSAEALLRVDCDELRDLSPDVYIPIAEKAGLIKDIGEFVFEEVCKFLCDERIKRSNIEYVELNLSVYQFIYNDLVDSFEKIRKEYGVASQKLNLEITETAATMNEHNAAKDLARFLELGYTLSLDDFGTGYSNLIEIIGSNYRNIKIDKSILWSISENENNIELLKSLMNFIKSMGSDIIQEGVETKEQLDMVLSCGCNYIQGFYFNPPISKDEFIDYIEKEAH